MRAIHAVVDPRPSVAVVPAAPEDGVERVEQVPVKRSDLHRADQWPDVLARQAAVVRESVLLQLGELEMPVE